MNFSLTQEQELLKDGLEKFLEKTYTADFKKSLLESKSVVHLKFGMVSKMGLLIFLF